MYLDVDTDMEILKSHECNFYFFKSTIALDHGQICKSLKEPLHDSST